MENLFVATLRGVYGATDEVEAIMIADQIKVNGEKDLEDGDTLDVVQVTDNLKDLTPEEFMNLLRRARNAVIRTRTKDGWDLGKEIDIFAHKMKNRNFAPFEASGYDHGNYLEIAREVLAGGNPIT